MIRRVKLRSFAKINLDLRVLRKQDGFHELRTVFQTISLADSIEIAYEPARRTAISAEPEIPNNLVVRAAEAILAEMRLSAKVHFRVTKNIPMGGGLGGGSSNAASVLLALPVLAEKPVSFERLSELGSHLGSDVPFFLAGGTALGVGRGTELYDLPDLKNEPILLFFPSVPVPTPQAYQLISASRPASGLTETQSSSKIRSFRTYVRALTGGRSAAGAVSLSGNDFEPVVFHQYPELKALAARLRKVVGAEAGLRMTGSGSTFFALFDSRETREDPSRRWVADRYSKTCPVMSAELVSSARYQKLWRRQLGISLSSGAQIWPPQSWR